MSMGIARELVKMGPTKVGKRLIAKAEDFIAGKISGSSWIPMKYKKLVLGRGDKPSGKELSFKNTPGEKVTKRMTKNAKVTGENRVKGFAAGVGAGGVAANFGPEYKNALGAMFADPSKIFGGPNDMTMDQLRNRTKKILVEKKAKSMKAAIKKALEGVKTKTKKKVVKPEKRPEMNKGGMPKKSHAKPGPYGKTYMKGGMVKKKK